MLGLPVDIDIFTGVIFSWPYRGVKTLVIKFEDKSWPLKS